MASTSPFFGKRDRESEPLTSRPAPLMGSGTNLSGSPVGTSTSIPPSVSAANAAAAAAKESDARLTVGPNIKLKGVEITDCDTLVVEGLVEATMNGWVRAGNLAPLTSADDAIAIDHNARNMAATLLPQIAAKAS